MLRSNGSLFGGRGPALSGLVVGCALLAVSAWVLAARAAGPEARVALRVTANGGLKDVVAGQFRDRLLAAPGVVLDDEDFNYFISVIALPVSDSGNRVLGYSLSVIVLTPLAAQAALEAVPAGFGKGLEGIACRAQIIKDWKLYVLDAKNLEATCRGIVDGIRREVLGPEASAAR